MIYRCKIGLFCNECDDVVVVPLELKYLTSDLNLWCDIVPLVLEKKERGEKETREMSTYK